MILDIVLVLLLFASLFGLVVVTRRALLLQRVLDAVADATENCLDSIDVSYGLVGKILQLPLAANDVKVIQIHKELKRVHANLLAVAAKLAKSWGNEEEKKALSSDNTQE